jgi:hypothetical protein
MCNSEGALERPRQLSIAKQLPVNTWNKETFSLSRAFFHKVKKRKPAQDGPAGAPASTRSEAPD